MFDGLHFRSFHLLVPGEGFRLDIEILNRDVHEFDAPRKEEVVPSGVQAPLVVGKLRVERRNEDSNSHVFGVI